MRLLHGSPVRRRELLDANPQVSRALGVTRDTAAEFVSSQAARVAQEYSLEVSGHRLLGLYRKLADCPLGDLTYLPRGQLILERYLDPQRLHLIRLET